MHGGKWINVNMFPFLKAKAYIVTFENLKFYVENVYFLTKTTGHRRIAKELV